MDIYYPVLSTEKITQQPAFELLSLLSEVGGFLGLLLGASMLTVCELLDFLTLVVIRRCKKKRLQENTPNGSVVTVVHS